MHKKANVNSDVWAILGVLGAAIFAALLLALFFIFFYGPSGRYIAGHALIDPKIMEKLNFKGAHPRTEEPVHFIFDRAEFSYFDVDRQLVLQKTLSSTDYSNFYQLIQSDESLDLSKEVKDTAFLVSHPVLLTTTMRTAEIHRLTTQIFQVVQITPENYYRIQLNGQKNEEQWAYFYHPHLYENVFHLFGLE